MKNQLRYLQNLFYDLFNDYGRVFLHIKYSPQTIIGSRGFTDEEKEKGLILVFNNKNHKNLQWTEDGSIVTALGFGVTNKIENCFIHYEDIISVFSPDAMVKFDRWDIYDLKETSEKEKLEDEKIVSLDNFRKSKSQI